MVRRAAGATALAAVVFAAVCATAAPWSPDPDWPCRQVLVPKLAAASYWSGPALDSLGDWHADHEVARLVEQLAPRRVSTEEGLNAIAAFARSLSNDRARRLGLLFLGLLDESNRERADLIDKLKAIGRRQRALAVLITRLGTELNAIPPDAKGAAAQERIDLQQRYTFSALNFEDTQRTVRYACEAPVALDGRLGAWARALRAAVSP